MFSIACNCLGVTVQCLFSLCLASFLRYNKTYLAYIYTYFVFWRLTLYKTYGAMFIFMVPYFIFAGFGGYVCTEHDDTLHFAWVLHYIRHTVHFLYF